MHTSRLFRYPLVVAALTAGPALAQFPHEVLFSQVPGAPSSLVPGGFGALFHQFREISISPSGNHWIVNAASNASSSFNDYLIVDGATLFRESFTVMPWDPNTTWRGGSAAINDNGQLAVGATGFGGNAWLVLGASAGAGPWNVLLDETSPTPGIAGGEFDQFQARGVLADGTVAFLARLAGTATVRAAYIGSTPVAIDWTTTPTGTAAGGILRSLQVGPERALQVSDDGAHWGTLAAVNSSVAVVDGHVVIESGQVVPGSGFSRPAGDLIGMDVDGGGRWAVWGRNQIDDHDWIVRDGAVIIEEGQPIVPGSSEVWGNTFPAFTHFISNRRGDFIFQGFVQGTGDRVLVLNGVQEVIRSGDPIDVDGNGQFDDNAIFGSVTQLAGWGENGALYLEASLFTPTFGSLGKAVLRIQVPGTGLGQVYCNSEANSLGTQAGISLAGSASVAANDLVLHATGLPANSFGYFLNSLVPGHVPLAGGAQGTLCLGGNPGRAVGGSILNSGASGEVSILANLAALPTPTGPVAGVVGELWRFQYWYRDANPAPTSNFTPGTQLLLQ